MTAGKVYSNSIFSGTGNAVGYSFLSSGTGDVAVVAFDLNPGGEVLLGIFSDAAFTQQIRTCVPGDFPSGTTTKPVDCTVHVTAGTTIYIAVGLPTANGSSTFFSLAAGSGFVTSPSTAYSGTVGTSGTPIALAPFVNSLPGGAAIFSGIMAGGSQYYSLVGCCTNGSKYDVAISNLGNSAASLTLTVNDTGSPYTCSATLTANKSPGAGKPADCLVTVSASTNIYITVTEGAGANTQYLITID
jgi:hypothetical protein